MDLGQHYFSSYPEKMCNVQQNSRPCRLWLYNANSYEKFNFRRNLVLHMFSTEMLRYNLVGRFKKKKTYKVSAFIQELDIFALLIG